jgi:hypothetical protein
MHLGTEDVIIGIEVNLSDGLDKGRIESAIVEIEKKVKQAVPYAKDQHIFIEVQKHQPPG